MMKNYLAATAVVLAVLILPIDGQECGQPTACEVLDFLRGATKNQADGDCSTWSDLNEWPWPCLATFAGLTNADDFKTKFTSDLKNLDCLDDYNDNLAMYCLRDKCNEQDDKCGTNVVDLEDFVYFFYDYDYDNDK